MKNDICLAFTTRLPLAVLIVTGVKEWENRSALPIPSRGVCGMSVSKSSDEDEYKHFMNFINHYSSMALRDAIPAWEKVKHWRGKMIAVMDFEASETPGNLVWDEGYRYWWKLSNVRLLDNPFTVRGNVGMWAVKV